MDGGRNDHHKLKKTKTFDNWLMVYTIYMGVVMQVDPGKPVLVKYLDLIHRAYKEYGVATWLHYDQIFHLQAAIDPTLLWDREHQQL